MNKQTDKNHYRLSGDFLTKVFLAITAVLVFFILPVLAYSADVTLAWDANDEPDLDGYKIHYGTSSGNYSAPPRRILSPTDAPISQRSQNNSNGNYGKDTEEAA